MSDIPQDHVRLFVACEVPDEVKEAIGETIEGLRKKSGPAVRWIKPEGVHVTLKFLGEVPVKKLPAVKLAIQEAVVGHSPFELEFSNIGTFGGREGLRIMWVGIAGDVLRLEALVRAVNAALAVVGFEPERRPFRPHLTLGRVRDEIGTRHRAEIEVAVGKTDVPGVSWRTSQVSLMRSKLGPGGASYEVLATFPLRVVQAQV
ncbi:MAG: RNA 2',3'-cyclic phosphodiesterase [Chloroflexi bacterium]|jgi:2'-5' RNA ligase|nr:RNA 2',3'-cyclic phosphodiesterase [Dehalococcoidia bacterium]MCO5201849.1 RNA 2',3'-cyclic phosphodiesterase [Chloroflexota bacterium]MCZ7577165.1 RNA 2',3'-cyclic phosphodiesterase [Dehalococcoidia bacterium]NJD64012.1 RNA 2',3'-cyclic phosphodiesterase [Chloroflexota bacterium]PWB46759.1 MAG: RNA 2',3'-cyclic phosphodiesterase [Dehalococcoidia bacterium]